MAKKIFLVVITIILCCGCGIITADERKVKELPYTIVEEDDLPEELKEQLLLKKETHFKLTYQTEEALYIVIGYGEKETGGYSIQVKDLYLTSNAVCVKTELFGPRKGEKVSNAPSYPYIILKTELRKEPVVFQ